MKGGAATLGGNPWFYPYSLEAAHYPRLLLHWPSLRRQKLSKLPTPRLRKLAPNLNRIVRIAARSDALNVVSAKVSAHNAAHQAKRSVHSALKGVSADPKGAQSAGSKVVLWNAAMSAWTAAASSAQTA